MLEAKLDYKKEDKESIFYRYKMGAYTIWFSQYKDNGRRESHRNCVGCIFSVGIQAKSNEYPSLFVGEKIGTNQGYPNEYRYNFCTSGLQLEDIGETIKKIKYAQKVLESVKYFFEHSEHKKLFDRRKELEK